jgi:glutathione S-transferase
LFEGDIAGYMNVMHGGIVGWVHASEELHGVKPVPAKSPLLVAWADHFGALEVVGPVMPDVNRLVEFAKMLHA